MLHYIIKLVTVISARQRVRVLETGKSSTLLILFPDGNNSRLLNIGYHKKQAQENFEACTHLMKRPCFEC